MISEALKTIINLLSFDPSVSRPIISNIKKSITAADTTKLDIDYLKNNITQEVDSFNDPRILLLGAELVSDPSLDNVIITYKIGSDSSNEPTLTQTVDAYMLGGKIEFPSSIMPLSYIQIDSTPKAGTTTKLNFTYSILVIPRTAWDWVKLVLQVSLPKAVTTSFIDNPINPPSYSDISNNLQLVSLGVDDI